MWVVSYVNQNNENVDYVAEDINTEAGLAALHAHIDAAIASGTAAVHATQD